MRIRRKLFFLPCGALHVLLVEVQARCASRVHVLDHRGTAAPAHEEGKALCVKKASYHKGLAKQPIVLTDEITPPPALVRAGLETLPATIRAQGERAGRRFIEFFTATIRNRNTRMAYARAAG